MASEPGGEDDLLLREGARLVHIGPPKTGTTSVQGAFHTCRAETEAQGVHYAGRRRHSGSAVQAVAGRRGFFTDGSPPPMSNWHALMDDVRKSKAKRVVISSEFFADALPESLPTIVHDLDPTRVHVVVTLRPLASIIPSQWQQYVQSNMRLSFDAWLDAMFNKPTSNITPSFWRRHRHDQLVSRWAEVVGIDNMTVVALDAADHGMVLRVFERLTGLREGTLVAPPDLANRSMTLPEVEAVRAFNTVLKAEGFDNALQSKVMHFGAASYMKYRTPRPDEPRVETPQWALDRTAGIAREIVDNIGASGVRIVGDLERLAVVPPSRLATDHVPAVEVSPEIAAWMAMGVLFASGLARSPRAAGKAVEPRPHLPLSSEPLEVARIPSQQLIGVVVRRARLAAVQRLRRIRKGLPTGDGQPG